MRVVHRLSLCTACYRTKSRESAIPVSRTNSHFSPDQHQLDSFTRARAHHLSVAARFSSPPGFFVTDSYLASVLLAGHLPERLGRGACGRALATQMLGCVAKLRLHVRDYA